MSLGTKVEIAIKVILAILLVGCLYDWSYGYYQLVRFLGIGGAWMILVLFFAGGIFYGGFHCSLGGVLTPNKSSAYWLFYMAYIYVYAFWAADLPTSFSILDLLP